MDKDQLYLAQIRQKEKLPKVDWPKAIAIRNRLVHDYMDVDLEIVYDVAINEVPALLAAIKEG